MDRPNEGFLVIHNVSKKKNIGNLVRSAVAFGFSEVLVVGARKYDLYGAHGSDKHIPIKQFHSLAETKEYLHSHGAALCGIEILPQSKDVTTHPFTGPTALMLGNEIAACDQFVYIPQFGRGTASLNVTVAGSIVMHHFATWANFRESERNPILAKYEVETVVESHDPIPEVVREREMRRLESERTDSLASEAFSSLFD